MQIKISEGKITNEEVSQYHLVTNHLIDSSRNIDKVIMYAETRYLMTILTSGVRSGKYAFQGYYPSTDGKTVKTVVPVIPQDEMIDDVTWAWRIMGRIQKESEVVGNAVVGTAVAGTSTTAGIFMLYLADDYLKNQMNTIFPSGKIARVLGEPTKLGPKKFLYKFQTFANESFDFTTWFLGAQGRKTVFGGYSSVGERSRRGYANFHFPDKYVQHTTKQRKSFNISGDATTNRVIWYEVNGTKGFVFEAEQQIRAQFLLEDEFQKWHGKSTMRDAYGNLLAHPVQYDEKNNPIVAGDSVIEQIKGANDLEASGVFGLPTWDDLVEMVKMIKKKRDFQTNTPILIVTGSDGIAHIEALAEAKAKELGISKLITGDGESEVIGYSFRKLKIAGELVIAVENPMFDDEMRYPAKIFGDTGSYSVQGSTMYFLDFSGRNGKKNVEIRARGAEGIDRNMYYSWFNGFTGRKGVKAETPVDQDEFHMFKENATGVYETDKNGILSVNKSFAA